MVLFSVDALRISWEKNLVRACCEASRQVRIKYLHNNTESSALSSVSQLTAIKSSNYVIWCVTDLSTWVHFRNVKMIHWSSNDIMLRDVYRRWDKRDRRLSSNVATYKISGVFQWKLGSLETTTRRTARLRSVRLELMLNKEWNDGLVNISESYTILTDIFHNLISTGGSCIGKRSFQLQPLNFYKHQEGDLENLCSINRRVGINIKYSWVMALHLFWYQ